jgi:ribosome recycling factor
MSIIDNTKKEMTAAIDHLATELKGIRTGRANPHLLDSVQVEVYGTYMRLPDMASVTATDARQLLISPYDVSNSSAIGKAIEKANLGVQCIVDSNQVRVLVQPPDQEVRKELVKLCKKRSEDTKVAVRNIRRKFNDLAKDQKTKGDISEDILKKNEKQIQTLTDEFCKKADDLASAKEKEIMHI